MSGTRVLVRFFREWSMVVPTGTGVVGRMPSCMVAMVELGGSVCQAPSREEATMGWWVTLEGAGPVSAFRDGGRELHGSEEATLSITYNYGLLFSDAMGDATPDEPNVLRRLLHGKRAGDTIPMLKRAIALLGRVRADDYWAATGGNAGAALFRLLDWAQEYQEGIWRVN